MTEAEVSVLHPQPPEAGRSKEGLSPGALEGAWPADTWILDFWPLEV